MVKNSLRITHGGSRQDRRHGAPEGDKVMRMSAQSAKIEAGYVLLPERAPWLQDFRTEILQFPHGRHDDQVDSLSQFLMWITKPRHYGLRIVAL